MDNEEQITSENAEQSLQITKDAEKNGMQVLTEKSENLEQEQQSQQIEQTQDNQSQETKNISDEELKNEVSSLKAELAVQKGKTESFIDQMRELYQLYPDADINTLSDEVWQSVKSGIPIVAAYALNTRRCEIAKQKAEQANQQNKEKSIGGLRSNNDNGYFSPSEVRGMSAGEVRKNYTKIIDSMNHWN